jgi:hypothetical protein
MSTYQTLSDELRNNIINFIDESGEIRATFDFCDSKPYFYGDITNDKEVTMINKTKKSKYNNMVNIQDEYYYGEYNPDKLENIMGLVFKISVQHHIFGEKYNYILLIIDNPFYEMNSEDINKKGKYKLIIYNICYQGVYYKYLNNNYVYISST